ncbi:cytochrome b [Roseomonas xinghualingensis]|uniref:cytochrome b n=1 Tax=Roseomonas xinghualingensis TaxID=2986475 RepID=UPI0021F11555|nr:cytochrome b [Roseomonas sp. SXEYE001]MCV4209266.1 cytochrome b [Roseomonas sp. SXEYE001]
MSTSGNTMPGHAAPLRYDTASRTFHWVTVALVLATIALGLWIAHARPEEEAFKLTLYNIHESIGVTIWIITLARLAWRLGHPAPPLPAELPRAIRIAARANHSAFYLWLLTMPLVGFLATNAWGFPLRWFGLIPLPDPVGKNIPLAETLTAIHRLMAWTLGAMIVLHVFAALWHQAVRRDGTLRKML